MPLHLASPRCHTPTDMHLELTPSGPPCLTLNPLGSCTSHCSLYSRCKETAKKPSMHRAAALGTPVSGGHQGVQIVVSQSGAHTRRAQSTPPPSWQPDTPPSLRPDLPPSWQLDIAPPPPDTDLYSSPPPSAMYGPPGMPYVECFSAGAQED